MTREEIKRAIREAIPSFLLKREAEGIKQKAKGRRQKLIYNEGGECSER
jgi:hypothetical protein